MMNTKARAILKLIIIVLLLLNEAGLCGTLLPPPQQVIGIAAPIALGSSADISASNSSPQMTFLTGYVRSALDSGGIIAGTGSSPVSIHFQLLSDAAPSFGLPAGIASFALIGEEGYALSVANSAGNVRIVVGASTQHGLFNGGMTVLQLLLTDAGSKELNVTPQFIRDYPDKPVRAGYLSSAQVTYDSLTQKYTFTSAAMKRIDQLAQIKFNTLYGTNWYQIIDATAWNASKDEIAKLQRYCHERFIDYVPAVGSVSSTTDIDHRDGWWINDEPFHFQTTESNLLFNGNFDNDSNQDGIPDGWRVNPIAPDGGAWTLDPSPLNPSPSAQGASGGPAMRLDLVNNPVDPTAANASNQLTLSQTIGVPSPGTYAVEVWVNADGLQGQQFQVTAYGVTQSGNTAPASLWVNANQKLGWTRLLSTQHLTIAAGDGVTKVVVYTRVMEPGNGTVYVDDIRLVRMIHQADGSWLKEPTSLVQEAVVDTASPNLVINAGLELDANGDGIPDGWVVPGAPSDPNGAWKRDNVEKHSGTFSMRLDLLDYKDPINGSNGIQLYQVVSLPTSPTGVPLSGHYLLTAWTKTGSVSAVSPQVSFYATSSKGQPPIIQQSIMLSTGSSGWAQHGVLLMVPENNPAYDRITVYARIQEPGVGTFWVDDISLRRIDGDLRNVMRRFYDIRVTSSDGATVYQQGKDYDVIDGEQISIYNSNLNSTRIRRRDNGAIPTNAKVRISYDQNLYYSDAGNFSANLCTSLTLDELYKPALDRVLIELPQLSGVPVSSINLSSDELRGMNRSGACRNADGSYKFTNAELLANFFNKIIGYAKTIKPDLQFDAWDDMFSPVHNGGEDYQLNFGGPPGKTVCAVDPSFCVPGLPVTPISKDLSMLTWWYNPNYVYQMNTAGNFFAKQGRALLMSPWYDETNIRDWATISAAMPASRGMMATAWGDAGAPIGETWVPLTTSLGWNAEWMQVLFAPFEAATQADLEVAGYSFTNAKQTNDRLCAVVAPSYLPQSNPGGVCMSAGGVVTLPSIPMDNSSRYQIVLEKSLKDTSLNGIVYWQDAEHKLVSSTPFAFGVVPAQDAGIGSSPNFWRATSETILPPSSISNFMQVQITSSSPVNIDNVMIRRSLAGCPDGRAVLTAPQVDLGMLPANTSYTVPIVVTNRGCEDLKISAVSADPSALDFTAVKLPAVVPAGRSVTLTGTGGGLSSGATLKLPVSLESNSDLQALTVVNVLVSSKPAVSLTVTKIGSGSITSTPVGINCGSACSAPYDANTSVMLTATAANDSVFGSWSGCDSVAGTGCTVGMNANRSVTATFNGLPDLVISTVSGPTAAIRGANITLNATTANTGIAAATVSTTALYLSNDATIASSDISLGTVSIGSLAAGATSPNSISVTLPSTLVTGVYYLGAIADAAGAVVEGNATATGESNNAKTGNVIQISGVPAAPSNLTATVNSRSKITLNWTDNATDESGFKIERSIDGTTFRQIDTSDANVKTYTSSGLSANTVYYYRIRAYNNRGNSTFSNTVSARTNP